MFVVCTLLIFLLSRDGDLKRSMLMLVVILLSISLGVLAVRFLPTRIPGPWLRPCAVLSPVSDLSSKKTQAIRGQTARVWDSPHSCLQIIPTPHETKRQIFIFMKLRSYWRDRDGWSCPALQSLFSRLERTCQDGGRCVFVSPLCVSL